MDSILTVSNIFTNFYGKKLDTEVSNGETRIEKKVAIDDVIYSRFFDYFEKSGTVQIPTLADLQASVKTF
jgi:hypothetical protein